MMQCNNHVDTNILPSSIYRFAEDVIKEWPFKKQTDGCLDIRLLESEPTVEITSVVNPLDKEGEQLMAQLSITCIRIHAMDQKTGNYARSIVNHLWMKLMNVSVGQQV